jgi:hypothetical protein
MTKLGVCVTALFLAGCTPGIDVIYGSSIHPGGGLPSITAMAVGRAGRSQRQRRLTHRGARRRAQRHRLNGAASATTARSSESMTAQPLTAMIPINAPPRVAGAGQALRAESRSWRSYPVWRERNSRKGLPEDLRTVRTLAMVEKLGYSAGMALQAALRSAGSGRFDRGDQTNPTLLRGDQTRPNARPNETQRATKRSQRCHRTNPTLPPNEPKKPNLYNELAFSSRGVLARRMSGGAPATDEPRPALRAAGSLL